MSDFEISPKTLPYRTKDNGAEIVLHWWFTNYIASEATILYELFFDGVSRSYYASSFIRRTPLEPWRARKAHLQDSTVEKLRAMLPPEEIARCLAASIAATRSPADADA